MTDSPTNGRRPDTLPISARTQLLHVLVVWGFALAQPVYDLLGRNPTFFVYQRWQPFDFLLFVLLLSLLLPVGLAGVVEILSLSGPGLARWARAGLVFVVATLLPLPLLTRLDVASPWLTVAVAAFLGAGAAYARERYSLWRQFLSILAPSILIFPGIFLFRDGIREQWLAPGASWESGGIGRRPPVVFLVLDALPTASLMDDRYGVDPIRYPNFARLAQVSTWFRNATTVDAYTAHSVPAILSGVCWQGYKAPLFQEFPRNVFTHAAEGYRFEAVETLTRLCPDELCTDRERPFEQRFFPLLLDATIALGHAILPVEWRHGLPAVDTTWGDFAQGTLSAAGPERNRRSQELAAFEAALARIDRSSPPVFLFGHLVLPHRPFVYLPSGKSYRLERSEPGLAETWALRHTYQRHLLQLAYVDTLLGRVFDRLDATGLFDESLVVVTADHGVSFRQGEPARHLSDANAVDILSVPLFIKRPGQQVSEVRDDAVQTVDILPTISEILEWREPSWTDGRSILRGDETHHAPLSCPQVRNEPAPSTSLAEIFAAADAKTALFGSGAAAGSFPAVGPRLDLVLASVSEDSCSSAADLWYEIENREIFERVDPASGFVPAEVKGLIKGPSAHLGIDLALAVNGTVVGTTRSYVSGARDVFPWSAIVPETAFRAGENDLALFRIRSEDSGCALQAVRPLEGEWEPSFLNVRLGAWPVPLVEERGFGKSAVVDGTTRRHLRRRAELRIPLSPTDAASAGQLKIELDVLDESGVTLKIRVNGKKRIVQRLEAGPWVHTFELEPRSQPGPLVVTLRAVGVGSSSERKSLLAVHGVWLLPGEA